MKSAAATLLFLATLLFGVVFHSSLFAQNNSEIRKKAYELLTVADALKNKGKNCAKAIEIYRQSLALDDFKRPDVYQSLAACYAQTGNGEKAFFYLERMLAVGWIKIEDSGKDADLKALLVEPRGNFFWQSSRVQR